MIIYTFSLKVKQDNEAVWLCGGNGETLMLEHEPALNAKSLG